MQKLRDDGRAKVGRKGFVEDSSVPDALNAIFLARLECRSADGNVHKSGRTASCYYKLFLTASGVAYTRSGKIHKAADDAEDASGKQLVQRIWGRQGSELGSVGRLLDIEGKGKSRAMWV